MPDVPSWRSARLATAGALAVAAVLAAAPSALANHPVLVEGNCNNPPGNPFFSAVPAPGTCGDYDGDGAIGTAEDGDGDRVFGTINAANSAAGANNNGTITIVESGLFPETVTLSGNITLEGAPGVEANIDAVRQGDPDSTPRQGQPGIVVDAPADRYVVVRNVQSRNWTSGLVIRGASRVALQDVRVEHNINYGVEVSDDARVAITGSEVAATGRRANPATGNFPSVDAANPGTGIEFEDRSSGAIRDTTVVGSVGAGVSDVSRGKVCLSAVTVFDNAPDAINLAAPNPRGCVGSANGRF